MNFDIRTVFFCQKEHSGIRNQNGIGADLSELAKIFSRFLKVIIMRKNIGGHINLYAMLVCKGNCFLHFFLREVLRLGTKPERLSADIYRIRSVNHCYF